MLSGMDIHSARGNVFEAMMAVSPVAGGWRRLSTKSWAARRVVQPAPWRSPERCSAAEDYVPTSMTIFPVARRSAMARKASAVSARGKRWEMWGLRTPASQASNNLSMLARAASG